MRHLSMDFSSVEKIMSYKESEQINLYILKRSKGHAKRKTQHTCDLG